MPSWFQSGTGAGQGALAGVKAYSVLQAGEAAETCS